MILWWIIYIVDGLCFFIVTLTALYMLIYTIAAQFSHHDNIPQTNKKNRFIIIIPAYKEDKVIESSVKTILAQTYPQNLFDVVVVSDHQKEITNFKLAQYPITLLNTNFEHSNKAKSLNYAMGKLPKFKIYDIVVILDADNMVETTFLEQMNRAYEASGTKVIQAHRLSKNRDTSSAILDSIFEEINNTIFRRGHVNLGLSAALIGSGVAIDFNWFRKNVKELHTSGEDKEMEALIMKDNIFIDYFDNILVFDEKTRVISDFNKQRGRWISTQTHNMLTNLPHLIPAIFTRRYDYADKIFQWMLMPRTIMMAIIVGMSLILPFIYLTLAIKWWVMFAFVLFIFALATPDYLVDKKFDKAFYEAPFIMLGALMNIIRFRRKFNHTKHSIK